LPDIDTLSYLFSIDEQQLLGHRGIAHSGVFALALALAVMTMCYRQLRLSQLKWWGYFIWFFLMTLTHGLFDALVDSSLGVAFFWPFTPHRYVFSWRPLMDVPVQFSALFSFQFWHAQWIECQFFSFLLVSFYLAHQLWQSYIHRPIAPVAAPMEALMSKS
jgi:membrane-bound metal-dependent hydrolase YbcI (DUF457 family)